jgi:hypothetical protein
MASIEYTDYMCASERDNIINERIYKRNIPSQPLQPYINARPASTKYSIMPIVDPRKPINEHVKQLPVYNTSNIFNPSDRMGPWNGFSNNIDKETELRNQVYALQKCSQAVYVPQSNSSLYNYNFKNKESEGIEQPFPSLFKLNAFNNNSSTNNCINKIQKQQQLFNNYTRQQLKDSGK